MAAVCYLAMQLIGMLSRNGWLSLTVHSPVPGASFILQAGEEQGSVSDMPVDAQGRMLMSQTKQKNTSLRPCVR